MNPYLNSLNGFGGGFIAFWPNQGQDFPDLSEGVLSLIANGQSVESFIESQESLRSDIIPTLGLLSIQDTEGQSVESLLDDSQGVTSGIEEVESVLSIIDSSGLGVLSALTISQGVLSGIQETTGILSNITEDGQGVESDIDETGQSLSTEL